MSEPQPGEMCWCAEPSGATWAHYRVRGDDGSPAILWVRWCDDCGGQVRICGMQRGRVYLDQTTARVLAVVGEGDE